MRNLDAHEDYKVDERQLHRDLTGLVGSFPAPREAYPAPYGVVGFGEAWWPAELAHLWTGRLMTEGGTQFVLQGGLDLGAAAGAVAAAEASGARVVRAGFGDAVDVPVDPHPLSPYRYLRFLQEATGEAEAGTRVDRALEALAAGLAPEVPTEDNPAKFFAWNLIERIPVWVVSERYRGLAPALQQTFARIAGSLSIAPPPGSLEFFITALEARHEQGDPLAAVVVGEDERTRLAVEILETRVDTVLELPEPPAEGLIPEMMAAWYFVAWASYYLAILYGRNPADAEVLARLREEA
ncbi:SIS domain-containing protein [Oceanithermus sp.]